jgi:heat-inducible transcriptional repressor
VLVVLITDTRRVEQRTVEVDADLSEELVGQLRARLNEAAAGHPLQDAVTRLEPLAESVRPEVREPARRVVAALQAALRQQREDRMVMAGAANLARAGIDFAAIGPVLEAIEEQVVLLRLLSEMADDPASGVSVRIGHENLHEGLVTTSVVSSGYGVAAGDAGSHVARLGVLGPTRMDYPTTMAAVRAVARYVSRILVG